MNPQRIQLSRAKGWRKPEGAIVVARPSQWGNWFKVCTASTATSTPRGKMPANYIATMVDPKAPFVVAIDKYGYRTGPHWAGFADETEARRFAVDLYRHALEGTYLSVDGPVHRDFYLGELRGHDLACWCPLDQPCHADVLLELANHELHPPALEA